jgi:hypothetical protein
MALAAGSSPTSNGVAATVGLPAPGPSTTLTVLSSSLATKAYWPSGVIETAAGSSPTGIGVSCATMGCAELGSSMMLRSLSPELATNAWLPSGAMAMASGLWPTSRSLTLTVGLALSALSITLTSSSPLLTT